MGAQGSKQGGQVKKKKYKGHLIQTLDQHDGGINCMSLSEDGSVLATGSEDKMARLWSTKTEECECIGILQGHEDYITCIIMEDNFVVTGSADKTIRKWDICTCDCVLIFSGHSSPVNRIICTGDFIFSSSYDRTSRCWDFDSAECVRIFSGHKRGVYPMVFIPADEEDVNVDTFDWEGNKDILITGSADFTARSWSFETGKTLKIFKGHTGTITCMGADPAGQILYTGSTDTTVKSWNIAKGENLKTFEGHNAPVLCMSVQNKILYTGSSDWTGKSWVVEFGDCTRTYKGHKHSVSCIKFCDGLLVTGSGDGISRIYEVKSGSLKFMTRSHAGVVNALQVVDDRLFTGSHDGTVKVWDISGVREEIGVLKEDGEEEDEEETRIILDGLNDEDYEDYLNGDTESMYLRDSPVPNTRNGKSNNDQLMDMV
ncbi:WDR86 [Bugula neritina]|uniref:WDR86 n=1 Tax=Bugula neritina TaxID=10212 RepID=A0A7J7J4T5_BUGNE|nr:WDR86 [Bugula neritina]